MSFKIEFAGKEYIYAHLLSDKRKPCILNFLELQGCVLDYSCRMGVCATCALHLLDGSVGYDEEPVYDVGKLNKVLNLNDEINRVIILACCSYPTSDIKLALLGQQ